MAFCRGWNVLNSSLLRVWIFHNWFHRKSGWQKTSQVSTLCYGGRFHIRQPQMGSLLTFLDAPLNSPQFWWFNLMKYPCKGLVSRITGSNFQCTIRYFWFSSEIKENIFCDCTLKIKTYLYVHKVWRKVCETREIWKLSGAKRVQSPLLQY